MSMSIEDVNNISDEDIISNIDNIDTLEHQSINSSKLNGIINVSQFNRDNLRSIFKMAGDLKNKGEKIW